MKILKYLITSYLLILSSLGYSATYGPNLIQNYHFEQHPIVEDKGPDCGTGNGYDPNCIHPFHWREWEPTGWIGLMRDSTPGAHSQSLRSMRIDVWTKGPGTAGVRGYYSYFIPVTQNKMYNWYFQTYSTNTGGRFLLAFYNASNQIIQWQVPKVIPDTGPGYTWATFSGNITAPAGAVKVSYMFDMTNVGVLGADNGYFRTYTP